MENRRSKRIGDFDWFSCTRRSRFASRRLLQVWVSSHVLIERPGYSVRLSLSMPDAPERPLVVVTSHLSASLKRGLGSRPPVRRLRFGGIRDSGTGEVPGLNPGNRLLPVVGGFSPSRLPDGLRRPQSGSDIPVHCRRYKGRRGLSATKSRTSVRDSH